MKFSRPGRSVFIVRDLPIIEMHIETSCDSVSMQSGKPVNVVGTLRIRVVNPDLRKKALRRSRRLWAEKEAEYEKRRAWFYREWREALRENGYEPGPDHPAYLPPDAEGDAG